jgi:sugar lactone lactonase YvrE
MEVRVRPEFRFLRLCGALFLAVAAGVSAQSVIKLPDSLYNAGDTITWVKKVSGFNEGPVWEASTGYVYFTRQTLGSSTWPIYRIKPGADTGIIWVANPGKANGLDLDSKGRLVAAQNGRLTRYKADGTVDSVLVTSPSNGVTFGDANDLAIGAGGDIYFTTYNTSIYYLSKTGQLSVAYSSATIANGIEWVEADSAVYVNESRQVKKYRVNANGSLSNPTTFITVRSGSGGTYADGGTIDAHGNFYIAAQEIGEIRVFNAKGDSIGTIVPKLVTTALESGGFSGALGNVSNVIFGGPDLKTLYFVGDGGLYSIPMKIPGPQRYGNSTALRAFAGKAGKAAKATGGATESSLRDARGRALSPAEAAPTLRIPATAPR